MNRSMSVYLDAIRLAAACVVVASHFGWSGWTGGLGWQFTPFGMVAVVVFFVLSGYVIAFSVERKREDLRAYAIARTTRIYSVVLPALLITAALGAIGQRLYPNASWGEQSASAYVSSVTFLNNIWLRNVSPGNDGPYWSVCYEVWYYAFFGLIAFAPKRLKLPLSAGLLAFVGPRIAIMLPTWYFGVWAYRYVAHTPLTPKNSLWLWICSFTAFCGIFLVVGHVSDVSNFWYSSALTRSPAEWREYALDYALAACVAANFIGFAGMKLVKLPLEGPIKWASRATFTLYLMHFPIGHFLVVTSPWAIGSWQEVFLVYGGTCVAVLLIAEITEHPKRFWRARSEMLWNLISGVFARTFSS